MRSLPFLAVILAGGTLLETRPAHACSCGERGSVEMDLAEAAAVFEGVVRAVGPTSRRLTTLQPGDQYPALGVDFEVVRRWKGEVVRLQVVLTPTSGASCGLDFAVGESYVVYATRQADGMLAAWLCWRTNRTRDAGEDLAVLGKGEPPLEVAPPGGGGCAVCAPGSAPWTVVALLVAWAARRRRR
jgi:MYXO-CTERM domain-containing protein